MADARTQEPGSDTPLLYALYLLMYLSVVIRMLVRQSSEGLVGPVAYGLMSGFLVLGVIQVPLSRRWPGWNHVHLTLQCLVVVALLLTAPRLDFYSVLLVGLAIIAGRYVDAPWDVIWLVILCVVAVVGLMLAFGPGGSVSYIPIYVASCLVLGMYGRAIRRTELARARSEELRAELENANRRLRVYADQAEGERGGAGANPSGPGPARRRHADRVQHEPHRGGGADGPGARPRARAAAHRSTPGALPGSARRDARSRSGSFGRPRSPRKAW